MIRRIVTIVLTIAVIVGWIPPMGGAVVTVPVFLDGNPLSDMAVLTQNRTLLPFRALFEPLGATVEWDPATRTVHATKAALSLSLTIGETVATVNGRPVSLDVPAQIIHDRTMVPVRFVAETLGATVGWDALSRTVIVSTAEKTPVTVRRVTDELALEIACAQGTVTLRLAGIAFPQTAHPTAEEEAFRRERRAFLEQWVGKSVLVEWAGDAGNAQGPADGYVFRPDGIFLNAELVSRGYASRAAHAADVAWDELLVHLQRDAERGKRGYWGLGEKGAGNVGGGAFVPATPTSGVFGGKAFDATRKATLQVPGATLQLVSRSGTTYTHLVKEQALWRVVKAGRVWGTLTVAQYAVRNGDYVYLLRYEPEWTGTTPLAVHLTLAGARSPLRAPHRIQRNDRHHNGRVEAPAAGQGCAAQVHRLCRKRRLQPVGLPGQRVPSPGQPDDGGALREGAPHPGAAGGDGDNAGHHIPPGKGDTGGSSGAWSPPGPWWTGTILRRHRRCALPT
jgi:Micrococcal nuclease (thermonuclease) homologs